MNWSIFIINSSSLLCSNILVLHYKHEPNSIKIMLL